MSKQIDDMGEEYLGLKKLSNAQYRTIENLLKENEDLKKQNAELQAKINEKPKLDLLKLENEIGNEFSVSDEETVCLVQLRMIRDMALLRELTLEETKKFEIIFKALNVIRGKGQKIELETKKLDNASLLKMLDNVEEIN